MDLISRGFIVYICSVASFFLSTDRTNNLHGYKSRSFFFTDSSMHANQICSWTTEPSSVSLFNLYMKNRPNVIYVTLQHMKCIPDPSSKVQRVFYCQREQYCYSILNHPIPLV